MAQMCFKTPLPQLLVLPILHFQLKQNSANKQGVPGEGAAELLSGAVPTDTDGTDIPPRVAVPQVRTRPDQQLQYKLLIKLQFV